MIKVKIENLKNIHELEISLPFQKGVYAITGNNGIGKSTLLNVLAKLVYRGALKSYLGYDGNENSRITYEVNGTTNIWIKTPQQWQRNKRTDDEEEIFLKGIYEASLIYGNRFSDASKNLLSKIRLINHNELTNAPDFIKENLGFILHGNKNHFNNLYKIPKNNHLGFKNAQYILKKDDFSIIHQLRMSSGEFLLIGLLDYIKSRIDYNSRLGNQENSLSLIILDEVELALHPSAQSKLISFLNEISNRFNFCIYFSTHSIEILKKITHDKIFHIEVTASQKIRVKNPCHPAYAARTLYQEDGYDYLILVEDELGKHIVQKIIYDNHDLDKNKLIYILPSGGWQEVIKMHNDFHVSKLAGNNCKIFTILDGDVKGSFEKKCSDNQSFKESCKKLNISFLPIPSVEKFIHEKLILNPNDDFFDDVNRLYNARSLNDIILDYKNNNHKPDSNGKNLYLILKECFKDLGGSESIFLTKLCDIIYNYISQDNRKKIEDFLKGQLNRS